MNEDEQWEELRQVTKNPMILLSAGARETILYLADEGEFFYEFFPRFPGVTTYRPYYVNFSD